MARLSVLEKKASAICAGSTGVRFLIQQHYWHYRGVHYGIYLIRHPSIIWKGLRLREQPICMFLCITLATLAVLSVWGMILEKATNALTIKLLRPKATTAN